MKRKMIRIALGVAIVGMFTSEAWTWQDDESTQPAHRLTFRLKVSSADKPSAESDKDESSYVFWGLPFVKFSVGQCSERAECCADGSEPCSSCSQVTSATIAAQEAAVGMSRQATLTAHMNSTPAEHPTEGVQWIPATVVEPSASVHLMARGPVSTVMQAAAQQGCQSTCPSSTNTSPLAPNFAMVAPPCPPEIGCGHAICDDNCPLAIHPHGVTVQAIPSAPTCSAGPTCPACPACPSEPARHAIPVFTAAPHSMPPHAMSPHTMSPHTMPPHTMPPHSITSEMHQQLMEARIENARLQAQNEMLHVMREQQVQHMQEKIEWQAEMMEGYVELKAAHLEEKLQLSTELARLQGTSDLLGNLIEPTMKLHADNARLKAIVEGQHGEWVRTNASQRVDNQAKVNAMIVKLKQVEQEKNSLQKRLMELEEKYERMASERANSTAPATINEIR